MYTNSVISPLERKGEKILSPGKKLHPQLEEDRSAPWRVRSAIKLQAEKDPEIKRKIRDAADNWANTSSSGSESRPGVALPVASALDAQDRHSATSSPRPLRQLSPDDDSTLR